MQPDADPLGMLLCCLLAALVTLNPHCCCCAAFSQCCVTLGPHSLVLCCLLIVQHAVPLHCCCCCPKSNDGLCTCRSIWGGQAEGSHCQPRPSSRTPELRASACSCRGRERQCRWLRGCSWAPGAAARQRPVPAGGSRPSPSPPHAVNPGTCGSPQQATVARRS